MSYSRWGSSTWYTFWSLQDDEPETRDNAMFEICCVASFTAQQLRHDMDGCIETASQKNDTEPLTSELLELRAYMTAFLADVDKKYPVVEASSVNQSDDMGQNTSSCE